MYDFEIVYVPGNEMGITDYLTRSPRTKAAEDKRLTEVITICFLKSLNEIKSKFLTKAVIDSFPKPFEPKFRKDEKKFIGNSDEQIIAELNESLKENERFQPIRIVRKLSRAFKANTCGKNGKRTRIMNESNALNSLFVKPKQRNFRKALT